MTKSESARINGAKSQHRVEARLERTYSRALRSLIQLQRLASRQASPTTPPPLPLKTKFAQTNPPNPSAPMHTSP